MLIRAYPLLFCNSSYVVNIYYISVRITWLVRKENVTMEKVKLNQEINSKGKKLRAVYDTLNHVIPGQGVSIDPLDLETLDNNIVALEKGADDLKQIRKDLALVFMEHFTGQKPPQPQHEEKEEEKYYDAAAKADPVEEEESYDNYQQQSYYDERDRDHMIMETLRTGFDLIKGIGRLIGMVKDIKNNR